MGKTSFSVVASRKAITSSAGFYGYFVFRQFLIQRIFHNNMSVFDFSLTFHSFPVLSVVLSREQAQQMSTHLRFFACWEFPKPFYFPSLNIPFEKWFLLHFGLSLYTTPHFSILPKQRERFLKKFASLFNLCRENGSVVYNAKLICT